MLRPFHSWDRAGRLFGLAGRLQSERAKNHTVKEMCAFNSFSSPHPHPRHPPAWTHLPPWRALFRVNFSHCHTKIVCFSNFLKNKNNAVMMKDFQPLTENLTHQSSHSWLVHSSAITRMGLLIYTSKFFSVWVSYAWIHLFCSCLHKLHHTF